MIVPVLLFILGFVLLIKGGDWFVEGAAGIAKRFKMPAILVGATVVSIGTTLPETMVSASSAVLGHGEKHTETLSDRSYAIQHWLQRSRSP